MSLFGHELNKRIKIIALVFFDRGSHGFEEELDEKVSVDDYIEYFDLQTRKSNTSNAAVVFYLEKTLHNSDGSLMLDDNGSRATERIYQNEKLSGCHLQSPMTHNSRPQYLSF